MPKKQDIVSHIVVTNLKHIFLLEIFKINTLILCYLNVGKTCIDRLKKDWIVISMTLLP